jgi:hypothetical protein
MALLGLNLFGQTLKGNLAGTYHTGFCDGPLEILPLVGHPMQSVVNTVIGKTEADEKELLTSAVQSLDVEISAVKHRLEALAVTADAGEVKRIPLIIKKA